MLTALITGASSGIGRRFAEQLAAQGYELVLVARRAERLREIGDHLSSVHNIGVEVLTADLSTDEGAASVERRIEAGASLDLVINNAGYATRALSTQLDYAVIEKMLRVNILALVRLSGAAMRRMSAAGKGSIINVASGTVFSQMPGNAGYGSSKNFVVAFTRHMVAEAAGGGVHVQLLIPGVIATEFHDVAGSDLRRFPPSRIMHADELVAASLKGLDLGETVCIPSLPDVRDWEAYVQAEQSLMCNVSLDTAAARYGSPRTVRPM